MNKSPGFAQLFLRLALGVGFMLPVLDRLGWLGLPGTGTVNWGDWKHFVAYTHALVPYVSRPLADALAGLATVAETVFAICLIVGYQLRYMALGAALLTFIFGICMATSTGLAAPFNYPVFVFTGAGLVLAEVRHFRWSIDCLLGRKSNKLQTIKNHYKPQKQMQ
ncbi:MAG: DoxX family membrane protein [Cytophagales bacterium]|nr:DoxX family membrane protein [Cytophagales bacterium]